MKTCSFFSIHKRKTFLRAKPICDTDVQNKFALLQGILFQGIQLIFEQHGFELHGFTYTWIFFPVYWKHF